MLLQLLTYLNVFEVTQASIEKLKNFPLSCSPNFNTDRISSIFHLHHGSIAPLKKDELPPLFLVSQVELITPDLKHRCSLTTIASQQANYIIYMNLVVEGQETGVQQQLVTRASYSSLKW